MSDIETLDRRAFLGVVAAGLIAAPLGAQAQTTASPDETSVPPAASITDAGGDTWALGAATAYGYEILRNGISAAGGQGTLINWTNAQIKVQNNTGAWYLWDGGGWATTTAPGPPPPPPPSNGWDLTPGQGNVVQSGGITAGQNCIARNGATAIGLGCEAAGGLAEGRYAQAKGNDSVAMGVGVAHYGDNGVVRGWNNVGTGNQSEVYGVHANDRGMAGANTFASGSNGYEGNEGQAAGDAQTRRAVLRCITTGVETQRMSSNANDYRVAFNTSLTTVDQCAFFVKGVTVARNAGQAGAWEWSVLLLRAVGAASIQLIDPCFVVRGNPPGTFALGFDSDWGVLTLNCTGTFGVIDWVASVLSVECVFDA